MHLRNFILIITLAIFYYSPAVLSAQHQRCRAGADRDFTGPVLKQREKVEQEIGTWIKNHPDLLKQRSVITIPVVVHVVWNKTEENIPLDQILSQINVLNQDFRAANMEIPEIPSMFQSMIADVEIEFCLASVDPFGDISSGVTRTYTDNSVGIGGTNNIHYTSMGGRNAWDPERYLNIWVAKFAGGVGGSSSFPGSGDPAEDGIQIDYRQFGTLNVEAPYHLGRTCTHEIGHYLNLEHVWGPSINSCCDEDDGVADTPNSCETYLDQCPSHPVFSCSQPDMFMNYMNYTDDDCMGMFTLGQKARMLATLHTQRPGLLNSNGCSLVNAGERIEEDTLVIYRNPVREVIRFGIESNTSDAWEVTLMDLTGKKIYTASVFSNSLQQIPTDGLPAGVYQLRCEKPGAFFTRKIVVVNTW